MLTEREKQIAVYTMAIYAHGGDATRVHWSLGDKLTKEERAWCREIARRRLMRKAAA